MLIESDIDECVENWHSCPANATCQNTIGSYLCKCGRGFFGNTRQCRGQYLLDWSYRFEIADTYCHQVTLVWLHVSQRRKGFGPAAFVTIFWKACFDNNNNNNNYDVNDKRNIKDFVTWVKHLWNIFQSFRKNHSVTVSTHRTAHGYKSIYVIERFKIEWWWWWHRLFKILLTLLLLDIYPCRQWMYNCIYMLWKSYKLKNIYLEEGQSHCFHSSSATYSNSCDVNKIFMTSH